MKRIQLKLNYETDTVALGKRISDSVISLQCSRLIIFLNGELGAGKTTMTRGFVHGMGFTGNVKSPTYALVEPYENEEFAVYHFDLYRLSDPEELEYLGIRDYFNQHSYCLIEWSEKAKGSLPPEDLVINIVYAGEQRIVNIESFSEQGHKIVELLNVT